VRLPPLTDEQKAWLAAAIAEVGDIYARVHRMLRKDGYGNLWDEDSPGVVDDAMVRVARIYDGRCSVLCAVARFSLKGLLQHSRRKRRVTHESLVDQGVDDVLVEIPQILRRRFVEGVSVRQMAREDGIKEGAMRSTIRRALEGLS